MAERRKRLNEKLDELDQHLEAGEPLDRELEEPLHAAIGNVRQAADRSPDEDGDTKELSESLEDLAMRFEVSHPKLTSVLNQISELLSGAGI